MFTEKEYEHERLILIGAIFLTEGVIAAIGATGGALGAAIMHDNDWKPGNITVRDVALAKMVGDLTIYGSLAILASFLGKLDVEAGLNGLLSVLGIAVGSTVITSAAITLLGAKMLGMLTNGTAIGFFAASGAAGGAVTAIALLVVACCVSGCVAGCAFSSDNDSKSSWSKSPAVTLDEITTDDNGNEKFNSLQMMTAQTKEISTLKQITARNESDCHDHQNQVGKLVA